MNLFGAALATLTLIALPGGLYAQDAAEQEQGAGSTYSEGVSSTHVAETEELVVGSNKEKVICKRDKVLGSRVTAKRVCKTAQEWEREKTAQREMVERGQNQRTLTGS